MRFLSPGEIADFAPQGPTPQNPGDLTAPLREGLKRAGHWSSEQVAGRVFPMACVALEVTQRCNLDCTLCYLSESAEAVSDLPMPEIERRLDQIHAHYGNHTTVQITGGDPTLRSADDLAQIVASVRRRGLRAALFTNGIRATPALLIRLAQAGLNDVVFHVDMTQNRRGFESEVAVNAVREDYINRARGLGLRILFNTTIFSGNVEEVPAIIRYFRSRAGTVSLASFQMQADTGRGLLRERDAGAVNQARLKALIQRGVGTETGFDAPLVGHPDCNAYTALLVAGEATTPLYGDPAFVADLFTRMANMPGNWSNEPAMLWRAVKAALASPRLFGRAVRCLARMAWALRSGLLRGHRPRRIAFFVHNFMDAEKLERDRCEACVFMVATAEGPLSMCVHNAKRESMILKPVTLPDGTVWQPLGAHARSDGGVVHALPAKRRKGRARVPITFSGRTSRHSGTNHRQTG
ncbi:MAG: radical SAM protein [Pseudomonadota bacterium]